MRNLTTTIRKGIAATIIIVLVAAALGAVVDGAAGDDDRPATIVIDALQVDDLASRASQLDDIGFRIEAVDAPADPVVGQTRTGRSASVDVAPGDYWVTVDRTDLGGVPCSGSDRVMVRVDHDDTLAVVAFVTTSAPIGFDPICMGVMSFPSGPILEPCVAERDLESLGELHLTCAAEWGLDLADLVVGTN
ncbi:MAG: hypothetical protein AAGA99_06995 [Actinomycetota bacterium]